MPAVRETPRHAALLVAFERRLLDVECVEVLSRTNTSLRALVRRHRLRRRAVAAHGFPAALRLRCWLQEAGVESLMANAAASMEDDGSKEDEAASFYLALLEISSFDETVKLQPTGVEGEISRDVDRTFPMHQFFSESRGDGPRQLGNVLKAVSLHTPDVGYCQGMNYVAAALLIHFNEIHTHDSVMAPQEASFWIVVALIRRFGMNDMWRHKMPGLSRCIHLYQQLLRRHFYDLHMHLKKIGMHPSLLVTQWFATLFARMLTLDVLVRVWDLILIDGWKMIYRVALAITAHMRPLIIDLDMEACSEFLKTHPRLNLDKLDADSLIQSAMSYKITRKMLQQLDEERHLEYLRLRLQLAPISVEHSILFPMLEEDGTFKEKETLDFIRSQLQRLDVDAASDMNVLRRKIEAVDRTNALATSLLNQKSYALSGVTFTFAERTAIRKKLRKQFDSLFTQAINEASSPRSSAISKARARVESFNLLALPSAAINYMHQSLAGCFDRAARIPEAVLSRQNSSSSLQSPSSMSVISMEDDDLNDDEEVRRNLANLELLVPHHAIQLQTLFRKVTIAERKLRRVQRRYEKLQRETQLAHVEWEESQQFKDRLADQMVQLILATERQKNVTMQELFAKVDDVKTATPTQQAQRTDNGEGI